MQGLCDILIVNILGEVIISKQMACEQRSKKVNLHSIPPGIYTVKVQNGSFVRNSKLVISG